MCSGYSWINENRLTQPNKLLQKRLITKMTVTFQNDRYLAKMTVLFMIISWPPKWPWVITEMTVNRSQLKSPDISGAIYTLRIQYKYTQIQ